MDFEKMSLGEVIDFKRKTSAEIRRATAQSFPCWETVHRLKQELIRSIRALNIKLGRLAG